MSKIMTGIIDSGGVTGETSWIAVSSGTGNRFKTVDINTTTKEIYVGGQYNSGSWFPSIYKFDTNGNVLLTRYYSNSQNGANTMNSNTGCYDLSVGTSGNVYWCGTHVWSGPTYYTDFVKCDSNLNVSWARNMSFGNLYNAQIGLSFLPTNDESLIFSYAQINNWYDGVAAYNSSGTAQYFNTALKTGINSSRSPYFGYAKWNSDKTYIYSIRGNGGIVLASKWNINSTTSAVWRQGNINSSITARDERAHAFVVDEVNNFIIYSPIAYYGSGSGSRNIMFVKKQASDGTQLAWKINTTNTGGSIYGSQNFVQDMVQDSTGQVWACGTYGYNPSAATRYPFFATVDSSTLAFTTTYRVTPATTNYTFGMENGCVRMKIINNIIYLICNFDSGSALFKFPTTNVPLGTWTVNGVTINISTQNPWGNATNYGFANSSVSLTSTAMSSGNFTSTPNSFSPSIATQILP